MEVILHVYDVTNSGNEKTDNTIMQINKIFKDKIGIGGIFHSAVQIYGDEEWSFGHCEQGTGVFSCPSTKNPMYTYREAINLGETQLSISKVNQILRELSREWRGHSYGFSPETATISAMFSVKDLVYPSYPLTTLRILIRFHSLTVESVVFVAGWVNRFANAGDTAVEIAGNTAYRVSFHLLLLVLSLQLRQSKNEIVTASKVAYRFMQSVAAKHSIVTPESQTTSTRGTPRLQSTWFKNLLSTGKPSSSSQVDIGEEDEHIIPKPKPDTPDSDALLRSNAVHETDAPLPGSILVSDPLLLQPLFVVP